jgi:SAM-dependent methyltransferase
MPLRQEYEALLNEQFRDHEKWTLPGICLVCAAPAQFWGDWVYSDGEHINFRERLVCPTCGMNNRQRFMAHLVQQTLEIERRAPVIHLFEQVTPFFAWALDHLPGEVKGSEYLGPGVESGEVIDGVRHEDGLALSFPDESLDVMVSNDVFEHVPDIDRVLRECTRVLRRRSRLFFSVPFVEDRDESTQRAELRDGQIVELLPAEYHGNPVSSEGSLVFYEHGWDLLGQCLEAGFDDAYLLGYWNALYGHLGDGLQLIFVAERGSSRRRRALEAGKRRLRAVRER